MTGMFYFQLQTRTRTQEQTLTYKIIKHGFIAVHVVVTLFGIFDCIFHLVC